ncbi:MULTISPECIES: Cu(I)-responsive transcriptional regulator [Acinetobacter]|uniref:Cu(I)-responsive transcriptional regulator n=1 Tax=Acinetobacter TaxID=469 RepID=UPI000DD0DDFB|nr:MULTISPECIES: Cu(I)-responsive transcriptional regulator [Acinetobacter]MCL6237724.1 Cu(I)-responsive transcriptional regulator [Acinetobacter amyesii]QOW49672.1 Cu(I)-responsive transcriptional regulator [Acinetobacter sp. YH12138]UUS66520.1 Cu(I)-responsive transcriptional regulator [Acinetobacter sp. YH12068_T]
MNIGQAAKASGISAKMIRYYESIGLLNNAQRTDAGYRVYSEADIKTLSFLRHARDLGFSSEQMKDLLGLWKNQSRQSVEVKALALKHIQTLNQKIADLQAMVEILQQSVDGCAGNDQADCTILNQIETGMAECCHTAKI